ncbi:MAG: hypothetical protein GEU99_15855 [Luteitalea sp.]|nr:hypothetical protein [Luteitalea sp.]
MGWEVAMRRRVLALTIWICLLALLCLVPGVDAQEFRGRIEGRVTDDSGAVVPGVTIAVTNVATNVASTAVTNDNGNYAVPFLTPGTYNVTAELSGFKAVERDAVEVRVGDRLSLNFQLEVGAVEEAVSVTAATPLLETRTGSAGQVIDERRIALMPLSDGNPFVLSRLAPGIAYHGDLKFSRPFDNAGTSSITADGAPGGNEFTLDGSPNMTHGRRVAFVPPAGAVQEFKVETANFDAQQGHTAGANINVTMKSGTNQFSGEGYYHYRDETLSGNDFFLERAGEPKDELDYKRFGGVFGGPIVSSRTFFFTSVEWLYDQFPEPGPQTVPTERMRNGDFSELRAEGIHIYDPLTARREGDRIVRDPFRGNIIPQDRLDPIAQQYLSHYPLPNQPGNQLRDNYFSTNPRGDDFYSVSARVDHQFNTAHRMFVRYSRNDRKENRGNWSGEVNGIRPTGNFLFRTNDALNIDHVWSISASSLLNLRGGWSQFDEPSIRQHQDLFDPASLGFSSDVSQLFGGAQYLPRFDLDNFAELGDTFAGGTKSQIYSFQPTWTRMAGNHTFRTGYDFRAYREEARPSIHAAGVYNFRSDFIRQRDNSTSEFGQDMAALLLGVPSGGSIDRSADRFNQVLYHGFFVQDDWRVSDKLTLNLGLRYEYEGAPTERSNRNVAGFDPDAMLSITGAAEAAYAANPILQVAPSDFRARGGLLFANDDGRGFHNVDKNNVQPRVGFAYQWDDKTALRGGWAMYTVPGLFEIVRQTGFSQATQIVPTPDRGLTFQADLANPFPDGVQDPPGASLGPDTFVGRTLERFEDQNGWRNGQSMRWVLSVQRELPGRWMAEASYVGNRGYDLQTDVHLNFTPEPYLSTSPIRDQVTIDFLNDEVTNPLEGLAPGTGTDNPTIDRERLLRQYPQFSDVEGRLHDGSSRYDSAQFRLEKRFSGGYTVLTSYTWSRFRDKVFRLNRSDTSYEDRIAPNDIPHRLVVNGIWELPFGRGRTIATDANRFMDALIGGWNVSVLWQYSSGTPLELENDRYFDGDLSQIQTDYSDVDQPVFDTSGFYFHDAAVQTNGADDFTKQRNDDRIRLDNHLRTLPNRLDGLRKKHLNEWNMSFVKAFQLAGRARAQLHIELYNAFDFVFPNDPELDPTNPNFGMVTSQNNLPRNIQLGFKLLF